VALNSRHTSVAPSGIAAPHRIRDPLYLASVALTSLVILFQGVWAGLFIREGKSFDATSAQSTYLQVHDAGARVAIVLAFVSLLIAVWRLRGHRWLIIGSALLFLLLMLESYIGGEIGDKPNWPDYHIPLAMALMALSAGLTVRAARGYKPPPS
jgi:fatty acid desaturase